MTGVDLTNATLAGCTIERTPHGLRWRTEHGELRIAPAGASEDVVSLEAADVIELRSI